MVIGSGRGDVVGCFLGEYLSKVSIFRRERDFGFRFLSGDSEFCCRSELGNERRVREEAFAVSAEDPVNLVVVQGVLEVLILRIMVKVVIEVGVIDSVYVDMAVGARKGFSKERVVPLGISGVGGVKIL